ncbi:hypothetical protein OG226_41125 [Streptomyces sp. NBC_01261]|uniref:hypothetical protein n=1 Tax=Streptomyces sp. NBC_01261 TaxID=2903802 RepID=UPI002E2F2F97|nr:hypothetical protein [Streptomyces sp. NBC_01261]
MRATGDTGGGSPGAGEATTAAVAVIAPPGGSRYPQALQHRARPAVAVTLGPATTPPAHKDIEEGEAYTQVITHTGDLRRTLSRLRAAGVDTVMAASPAGVELAEQIAWQLRLPATGNPATARVRTDHGVQAETLSRAGITVPRILRTTRLTDALAWADSHQPAACRIASATIGVPVATIVAPTYRQITALWPRIQEAARHHAADTALVIQEPVAGRHYLVDTISRLAPEGPLHTVTGIWSRTRTQMLTGDIERTDLMHRHDLLARRLTLYTRRVLHALGVMSGPTRAHIAFEPERGPILLSAAVVTDRSSAEETVWQITGHDPADAALDPAARSRPASRGFSPCRVTRIRLAAPITARTRLVEALTELPTTACVDVTPAALMPQAPAPPDGESYEIVLAHADPGEIDKDARRIATLTADLRTIGHP